MREDRKHLVKRFSLITAMAGMVTITSVLAAEPAGAAVAQSANSSVLTNVTPGAAASAVVHPLVNGSCCKKSNNVSCC